jgi:hypothetical protein
MTPITRGSTAKSPKLMHKTRVPALAVPNACTTAIYQLNLLIYNMFLLTQADIKRDASAFVCTVALFPTDLSTTCAAALRQAP